MKFLNCSLSEVNDKFKGKRIAFFGAGSWLNAVEDTELMLLKDKFAYILDNSQEGTVRLGDIELDIKKPECVLVDKDIVIIITSAQYMYDMYMQLLSMNLSDEYSCYALPFIQRVSNKESDGNIQYRDLIPDRIPKVIHSFWFSGEEKPTEYQECIDSWRKVLPEYEIIEWNMDNYDWKKHPFVQRAIDLKAWAFAADFARLDVVYEYGGIYLDMDVEVVKPFDDLLGNDALLAFSNNIWIDLAVFGASKGNELINSLRDLYNGVELPETKKGFFKKYYQLAFVRKTLTSYGIKMNGSLQKNKYATAFPKSFFIVEDYLLRDPYKIEESTYCIHHANCGWNPEINELVEKRRLLWEIVEK